MRVIRQPASRQGNHDVCELILLVRKKLSASQADDLDKNIC